MGMTIENVATKMRRLAWEIGGNHHSLQEAEQLLLDLADQLSEININMSIKLNDALKEVDDQYTGVSKEYRFLTKRQKNIEDLANRNKDQEAAGGNNY